MSYLHETIIAHFQLNLGLLLHRNVRANFLWSGPGSRPDSPEHRLRQRMILVLFGAQMRQQILPFGKFPPTNRAMMGLTVLVLLYVNVEGLLALEGHSTLLAAVLRGEMNRGQVSSHASRDEPTYVALLQLVLLALFPVQDDVVFLPVLRRHIVLVFGVLLLVIPVGQLRRVRLRAVTALEYLIGMEGFDVTCHGAQGGQFLLTDVAFVVFKLLVSAFNVQPKLVPLHKDLPAHLAGHRRCVYSDVGQQGCLRGENLATILTSGWNHRNITLPYVVQLNVQIDIVLAGVSFVTVWTLFRIQMLSFVEVDAFYSSDNHRIRYTLGTRVRYYIRMTFVQVSNQSFSRYVRLTFTNVTLVVVQSGTIRIPHSYPLTARFQRRIIRIAPFTFPPSDLFAFTVLHFRVLLHERLIVLSVIPIGLPIFIVAFHCI